MLTRTLMRRGQAMSVNSDGAVRARHGQKGGEILNPFRYPVGRLIDLSRNQQSLRCRTLRTVRHCGCHLRERAVTPSEIHKLPDLTGYLKLARDYPIAKMKRTPKDYPVRNRAIVEH